MKFQFIIKSVCFASIFFCVANYANADVLSFKTGDQASYTITQKLDVEQELFDVIWHAQSETTIAIDMKILSSNPETFSYPFDVEVTLKKLAFYEREQDEDGSRTIKYDSKGVRTPENTVIAEYLDKLIDHPLSFRVEGDFQVKETSGYLANICEVDDFAEDDFIPSDLHLLGTTPWSFELLLTQLFHLSGENLLLTNAYPVSCYQFLNWEDDKLDEQFLEIEQSSAYTVTNKDTKKIAATWKGTANVTGGIEDSKDEDLAGNVSLVGNVTWDITNPMVQQRDLEAQMDESCMSHVKMSVQQTWQSTPL